MHRVNQRERLIPMNIYRKEIARARLGDNIANHMGFIFALALYDKFDLTFKQITNYYTKTVNKRVAWQDDDNEDVTSESMMEYCRKRKIDVVGWVKSIPMSQKLYMADIQKGRAVLGADRNIESALASTMYLTIPTLKESYRFSNAKIEEFMKWVAYYIDSYWRKQPKSKEHYLSDAIIRQTYRLGWTEQCKDGSKMGVGCPEYILLFRKLPTDRSTAYADDPVKKSKEDYTRAQWQIDAHGYWRSSGNRLISKEELKEFPVDSLQQVYREYSRGNVYNYEDHVKLAEDLDKDGKLPATFMVVAPGSWNQLEVWDDINRMRTLNTTQSRRRAQMHVCPLQLDIVERIINRYSNEGDTVYDPFGGLMTVPMTAIKMHRNGKGCELNPDYFRNALYPQGKGYSQEEVQAEVMCYEALRRMEEENE